MLFNEVSFNDSDRRDQYDRFAAEHPSGSFLQSWKWGSWQETLGHRAVRILITNGSGDQPLLSAQLIARTIPLLRQTYAYLPYGPLTSPYLTDAETQDVLVFFAATLLERYPRLQFLRFEPRQQLPFGSARHKTKNTQPGKTLVLDLRKTADTLLQQMHHKTRYNIKVAERHGVSIRTANPAIDQETLNIGSLIESTAARHGFKDHRPGYYRRLLQFFSKPESGYDPIVTGYEAILDDESLSAAIMMDHGTSRTYLFGGSSETHRNLMAPYLLHWTAIRDAQDHKLSLYDFWGIETASGATPGFVRFKLGFGGTEVSYPGAYDVPRSRLWYTSYEKFRAIGKRLRNIL